MTTHRPALQLGPREPEQRPVPRRWLPTEPQFAPVSEEPLTDLAFNAAVRTFPGWDLLTERELEVLQHCIVFDEMNLKVAEALCLSVKTIEAHRTHIATKLGFAHRGGLIRAILIAYGRALERASLHQEAA